MSVEVVDKKSPALKLGTIGKYLLLAIGAFLTLGPMIWTAYTALTPTDVETGKTMVGFSAFADVFDRVPLRALSLPSTRSCLS